MVQKIVHTVFILLLALIVPFSSMSHPSLVRTAVKKEQTSKPAKEKEQGAFVQPQLVQAPVYHVQALSPCVLDLVRCEIVFPQQEVNSPVGLTLSDKGTTAFFKTLFRHFIATQAP